METSSNHLYLVCCATFVELKPRECRHIIMYQHYQYFPQKVVVQGLLNICEYFSELWPTVNYTRTFAKGSSFSRQYGTNDVYLVTEGKVKGSTYTSGVCWWMEELWWWCCWCCWWRAGSRAGSWLCGAPDAADSSCRGRGRTGLEAASTRTRCLGSCPSPAPGRNVPIVLKDLTFPLTKAPKT